MSRVATRAAAVPAAVALAVLAACAGGESKADGPAEPVELVLTNNDSGNGVRTTPAMGRFVDLVEELSGGQLVIRVEPGEWATDGQELRDVAAGRADLGWTGTRVLDTLGVPELQPLHAPFLIDSFELQAAVLRSDVPATMLPALERLGVAPLAIMGDGLRHPASAGAPLLGAGDWAGKNLWLLDSAVQEEAVDALGGAAIHGGDIRQMLYDGSADGLESMWIYYALGADYLYAPYVVANVVLSPRTTVLFANPGSLAALDDTQRGWIEEAAAAASDWSVEHAADDDPGYVADACRYGARIALATDDQLASLRAAVAPIYDRLRSDPATADTMAAIERLKAETGPAPAPEVPDGCAFEPSDLDTPAPQAATGPGTTGDFPPGTYRYELTQDDVVQAGDAGSILQSSLAGVFTWEMHDGEWTVKATPSSPDVAGVTCHGWYAVDRGLVTFTYDPLGGGDVQHCLPPVWTAHWAPAEGGVQWGPPSVAALVPYFAGVPWQRIE